MVYRYPYLVGMPPIILYRYFYSFYRAPVDTHLIEFVLVCDRFFIRPYIVFTPWFHLKPCIHVISVADPWHFGGASGSGSWILLFSSLTFKMQEKKLFLCTIFSAYYFLKVHLHHFSKIKSKKESQNSKNQSFSYYFCMMIEGSGSGSIPLTRGSGSESGRHKNMWIRIRIRIRNTACNN